MCLMCARVQCTVISLFQLLALSDFQRDVAYHDVSEVEIAQQTANNGSLNGEAFLQTKFAKVTQTRFKRTRPFSALATYSTFFTFSTVICSHRNCRAEFSERELEQTRQIASITVATAEAHLRRTHHGLSQQLTRSENFSET